jgi:putative hydrolase of the HAD superfamily
MTTSRYAVLFDIGNVLLHVHRRDAQKYFESLTGKDSEVLLMFYQSPTYFDYERGRISTSEFISCLNNRLDLNPPLNKEQLKSLLNLCFSPYKEMLDILDYVHNSAYTMLLSNTNPLDIEVIEKNYALLSRADGHLLSYEVGYRKPEPEIFLKIHEIHGYPMESVLFIDDKEENIASARSLGIHAIHFKNDPDKVVEFLKKFGLIENHQI